LVVVITSLGLALCGTGYEVVGPLPDEEALREFLEGQYVVEVGLLRASLRGGDSCRVWVANDVLTTLSSRYGGGWNGKVDILLGRDIPDMFYSSANISYGVIYSEGLGLNLTIYKEVYNCSSPMLDWYEYADLLTYRALDYLLHGFRSRAEQVFINLTRMWDGYGFRDKAFNGTYATYKCALFTYLYRALDHAGSDIIRDYNHIYSKCLEAIKDAQDPTYGGIHTDYRVVNGEVIIEGDMNVETTSMVVLALYSNYPEVIGGKAKHPNPK